MSNAIDAALGGGLFGLASLPMTGGGSVGGNVLGQLFGCWIAEAIYGVHDIRTHVVRQWLNTEYARTKVGGVVMVAYRKFGRQLSRGVRGPVRWALKPLFDVALRRALA